MLDIQMRLEVAEDLELYASEHAARGDGYGSDRGLDDAGDVAG